MASSKKSSSAPGSASAPSTGALYLALQRMEREGLIEEAPPRPESDARRRYYRLSAKGRQCAEQESMHLVLLVAAARDKKLIEGGAS